MIDMDDIAKEAEKAARKAALEHGYSGILEEFFVENYKLNYIAGFEIGRTKVKIKIAKNLLSSGDLSMEQISHITELSLEELEEIRDELKQIQ